MDVVAVYLELEGLLGAAVAAGLAGDVDAVGRLVEEAAVGEAVGRSGGRDAEEARLPLAADVVDGPAGHRPKVDLDFRPEAQRRPRRAGHVLPAARRVHRPPDCQRRPDRSPSISLQYDLAVGRDPKCARHKKNDEENALEEVRRAWLPQPVGHDPDSFEVLDSQSRWVVTPKGARKKRRKRTRGSEACLASSTGGSRPRQF